MKSEILPMINEQIIRREEEMWRIKLPSDYYHFLLNTNGGVPKKGNLYLTIMDIW